MTDRKLTVRADEYRRLMPQHAERFSASSPSSSCIC